MATNLTKRLLSLGIVSRQNASLTSITTRKNNTFHKLQRNFCFPRIQRTEFCCKCRDSSLLTRKVNFLFIKRSFSGQDNNDNNNNNNFPPAIGSAHVEYRNGQPVIHVPLPSRKEKCMFMLRPVVTTVTDFIDDLKKEDKGIDRAAIYTTDNFRVAGSTLMETVLRADFSIQINDSMFSVSPPKSESPPDILGDAGELRRLIGHLYSQLNLDDFKLQKEIEIKDRIASINEQLIPLQKHHQEIAEKAGKRTHYLMWGGLCWMSVQFGLLARLTWWEYSWDIMEPVTYFVTYGSTIFMYGYFLLTKQDYAYPDARDRQYLISLHKAAESSDFSIHKYNSLLEKLSDAEKELDRLRDPVHMKLPMENSG